MSRYTLIPVLLLLSACAHHAAPDGDAGGPRTADQLLRAGAVAQIKRQVLERDSVPRFLWSSVPQTAADAGVEVTVAPLRVEAQPWNEWPDGTARLFNDGVGYLWSVEIRGRVASHWAPAQTVLAVNDTEQTFTPAGAADALLEHLLYGARAELEAGLPPDLGLRLRNADPFRRAYLGTDTRTGDRTGVILFPAPATQLQGLAAELTLGVWVEGVGVRTFDFLFQ